MSKQSEVQIDEQAILEIIKTKNVHTFFQPVVSITTKSIIGFEAYSRGGGGGVCVLDPAMLFHDELKPELKVNVDRLCREKAFEQFKPIYDGHQDMCLFVNISPEILPHVETGSMVLKHQVASMDIDFDKVVIECPLNKATTLEVEKFSSAYKELGFRICLDNCSADDSFGQIVSRIEPDFVKVNQTFYAKDERKDYSAKALDMVVEVVGRVGGMVIAQGVESEDDSIRLLTAGVHLQQGYYYTKDENVQTGDPAKMFFQKIIATYDKYRMVKGELVKRKKERFELSFKAVSSICSKFANLPEDKFEGAATVLVRNLDDVISVFVVNDAGEQITRRVHVKPAGNINLSARVMGVEKGVDHSVHDYIMYLDMGYEKFVTRPFLSPYTGEETCIISKPFYNREGLRYIVCIEMPYPG
ncbi:MAG: EAL domain-containing protein [Pseudodesulfovibrio sp.]|nr:EAL domain-containing protein [Pseudodesulfovibrio sp.]